VPDIGLLSVYFSADFHFRAHLSRRCPSFVEDQALHVVSQIDEGDLGLGTFDTNGPYEQCHMRFFLRKDMFDPRTDLRFDPIGGTEPL
jgi:hypothetical protein